jgi:hypothetical protein
VQPQNSFPALAPRLAARRTIGFEHSGQLGAAAPGAVLGALLGALLGAGFGAAGRTPITPYSSRTPSTPTLKARHCCAAANQRFEGIGHPRLAALDPRAFACTADGQGRAQPGAANP